jgi:hypothetical protein
MAIRFITNDPEKLLASYKKLIDDQKIKTWRYTKNGYFTHIPDQWDSEAWLLPKSEKGELVFNIRINEGKTLPRAIYAVYHGRFIESVITHCPSLFSMSTASPNSEAGDAKITN